MEQAHFYITGFIILKKAKKVATNSLFHLSFTEVWKIQPKSFLTTEDFWHAVFLGNWNIVVTSFMSGIHHSS